MEVTVYSPDRPCTNCLATKYGLKKEGIPFDSVIATDAEVEAFKASGILQFPVVRVDLGDGATWTFSGPRDDDNIGRLKKLHQETLAAAA